jgi:hypothetical protein
MLSKELQRVIKNKLNVDARVTLAAFVALAIYALWFTTETATNILRGDDWRFLLIFYKKWINGTLHFRDLFSDHHPTPFYPIVFIFNAEFFSLQGIYGAWFGFILKMFTGVLLVRKLFSTVTPASSTWPTILFPLYIVMLFFGMNEFEEYIWPLVSYGSNMTFFCGLVTLIFLDKLLAEGNAKGTKAVALFLAAIFSLLLMGTYIKLFFLSSLIALLLVVIAERKITANVALATLMICLALVFYSFILASLNFPKVRGYAITVDKIIELSTNWFENFKFLAFGLAAGITSIKILHYPSVALNIFAAGCLALVGYSVFAFYKERIWKVTLVPVVLVIYLLLTLIGAIVFRGDESFPGGWPLYIPRYFPTYHMGWIGVVWIYYYKVCMTSHRNSVLAIPGMLLLGISFLLCGLANTLRTVSIHKFEHYKAEVAACKYANGDLTAENDIPIWIRGRGHSFSREAVLLLKERKLNIFSSNAPGYRCAD